MTELDGVDVHGSKGPIGWQAVAGSGRRFAFVKASEGRTFVDARIRENVLGARAAGLHVGPYHFARPDLGNTPEKEAAHFLRVIEGLPYDLLPVLDIERGSGDMSGWALDFLGRVSSRHAKPALLYTYSAFAPHLRRPALAAYPLWLARYRSTPPVAPPPWSDWTVWQHSSSGSVPGVPGRCDLNRMHSSRLHVVLRAMQPLVPPSMTHYPGATVRRIDLQIDTDHDGRGYRDIDVSPAHVVSVLCNTANPPDSGYKPIPDVARLDIAGATRVVVEEAIPDGRIDVTVWALDA